MLFLTAVVITWLIFNKNMNDVCYPFILSLIAYEFSFVIWLLNFEAGLHNYKLFYSLHVAHVIVLIADS